MTLSLALTPSGHLRLEDGAESQPPVSETAAAALRRAFGQSSAEGLLLLGTKDLDQQLPADFVFWRGIARDLFQRVCHLGEAAFDRWASLSGPSPEELAQLVAAAPPHARSGIPDRRTARPAMARAARSGNGTRR